MVLSPLRFYVEGFFVRNESKKGTKMAFYTLIRGKFVKISQNG